MPHQQYQLREAIRRSARRARDHGAIADDLPRVRGMEERGLILRENALFDDQTGSPVIGYAVIGTMTCGEPEE